MSTGAENVLGTGAATGATTEKASSSWPTLGYTGTSAAQTGGADTKPSWMTGAWDAPWWGQNASTGQKMSNADLTPKAINQTFMPTSNSLGGQGNDTKFNNTDYLSDYQDLFSQWPLNTGGSFGDLDRGYGYWS